MPARTRIALLGVAVGIVLADSSVVTIALPEILAQYDVEIETLAWALTSFNLALALSALPAAFVARRRPTPVFAAGAVVFAAASLTCAFAPSFDVLVAARTVQGVAGAAVVCAALGLLAAATGADAPAARIWAFAGILGAACGPAAGGILTQLFGWESIFVVQAPLLLPDTPGAPWNALHAHSSATRAAAPRGERRTAARLRRTRRSALPARDPVDQRLAAGAARRRRRGDGDADLGHPGRALRGARSGRSGRVRRRA